MMEFNGLFFDACRDGASLVGEAADSYVCCRSRDEDGAAGLNCGGAAVGGHFDGVFHADDDGE